MGDCELEELGLSAERIVRCVPVAGGGVFEGEERVPVARVGVFGRGFGCCGGGGCVGVGGRCGFCDLHGFGGGLRGAGEGCWWEAREESDEPGMEALGQGDVLCC